MAHQTITTMNSYYLIVDEFVYIYQYDGFYFDWTQIQLPVLKQGEKEYSNGLDSFW